MLRELFQKEAETALDESDHKLKQLLQLSAELDKKESALFQELDINPDQIDKVFSNPEYFTEEAWAEVQKQLSEHDQKMSLMLTHKRDRNRLRKTYSERSQVERHWLFVR